MFLNLPWLTLVVFLPLVGAGAIYIAKESAARQVALGFSSLVLLVSLPLWVLFDNSNPGMQFVERH